jgi:diguanylate cyclase (GGDEF)-like protein
LRSRHTAAGVSNATATHGTPCARASASQAARRCGSRPSVSTTVVSRRSTRRSTTVSRSANASALALMSSSPAPTSARNRSLDTTVPAGKCSAAHVDLPDAPGPTSTTTQGAGRLRTSSTANSLAWRSAQVVAGVADSASMDRLAWRYYLGFGVVLTAGYPLLPDRVWQNVVYASFSLATGAAMIIGTRWRRPRRPLGWYLLGAGHLLTSAGDIVYSVLAHALKIEPFPSPADACYLAGYAAMLAGLIVMIRGRGRGHDRPGALDACIIAVGFGLVMWVFVMAPAAHDGSLGLLGRLVSVSYPLFDIILVALLVRAVGARVLAGAAGTMLAAATVAQLLTDVLYAWLTLYGSYEGGAADTGWLLFFALSGAAALHPTMHQVTQPNEVTTGMGVGRRLLLASATLLAPAVAVTQWVRGDASTTPVIACASAAMFLLVLARMTGLVRLVNAQNATLDELARVDALTGVPNRRTWDLQLDHALARAARSRVPVHVAMLDLDHFKRYNDAYGHQAGDRVLKEAVAAWRGELRSADVLARYGGEEFGVLLEGLDTASAAAVLDRLRLATPLDQTVSIGFARWDGVAGPDELLAAADRALYLAKEAGRNQVMSAEPATV